MTTSVAVLGAAGKTGSSVVNGLLEAGNFDVTALTRPSSIDSPQNQQLKNKGVKVVSADLEGAENDLVKLLKNIDVVVSVIGFESQLDQIPLANAAKKAGVKRFMPCGVITVAPPGGVMWLRDIKEEVYNHIKQIGLPYTIFDIGWWYQIAYPRLPSGKLDYAGPGPMTTLVGDGNVPSALTDLDDVGRYVARIIVDDRTINKYVLAYNETWTPNDVFALLEKLSGEQIPRDNISEQQLRSRHADAIESLKQDPSNMQSMMMRIMAEYQLSWGVRGDNTPEYAKYLGYLTSKELYPDQKYRTLEDYFKDLLAGKGNNVFAK